MHKEFQKAIEAAVCRYVPEKGILSVMVSVMSAKCEKMNLIMVFAAVEERVESEACRSLAGYAFSQLDAKSGAA